MFSLQFSVFQLSLRSTFNTNWKKTLFFLINSLKEKSLNRDWMKDFRRETEGWFTSYFFVKKTIFGRILYGKFSFWILKMIALLSNHKCLPLKICPRRDASHCNVFLEVVQPFITFLLLLNFRNWVILHLYTIR